MVSLTVQIARVVLVLYSIYTIYYFTRYYDLPSLIKRQGVKAEEFCPAPTYEKGIFGNQNCIFGSISEKQVLFLIDNSFKMNYRFYDDRGNSLTRRDYIQQRLIEQIGNLTADQKFNILLSSQNYMTSWREQDIQANEENIADAISFLVKSDNQPIGDFNIMETLQEQFSQLSPYDKQTIYLISADIPENITGNLQQVRDKLAELNLARKNKVAVHSIGFLWSTQTFYTSFAEKQQTINALKQVSAVTNGKVRIFLN